MSDVTVRPAAVEDCEAMAGWLSQPDVNRWLGSEWRGAAVDARRLAFALKDKQTRVFVVLAGSSPCGLVVISNLDAGDGVGLLWYAMGDSRFGRQGVMTRAVARVLDVAFAELGLNALQAWIHPDNIASLRVLEKAGFRAAGRLRDATVFGGVRADRLMFDVTLADWRSARTT